MGQWHAAADHAASSADEALLPCSGWAAMLPVLPVSMTAIVCCSIHRCFWAVLEVPDAQKGSLLRAGSSFVDDVIKTRWLIPATSDCLESLEATAGMLASITGGV